ncbi:Crp/Fnr family transcriptional regulator [Reichenbachiella versicolor]|uniref:Crp/Fnr family transcriptional regulator n=1 Tax=Reichenbachiella versicolor TaxID=1821036 RepID=UPI000D6DD9A2|nr:Crp/Fnr family transcriptional regulator [Reichenbachiella versicolor]
METLPLVTFLQKFGTLTTDDISIISEHCNPKEYTQGDVFVEAGKNVNQVDFVLSGVFRYYFYDKEGNEITSFFMAENDFVTNVNSFFEYIPSSGTIAAETDCSTLVISRSSWELFSEQIPNWNMIMQAITNKTLLAKSVFQRKLINQDAKTSYLELLKQYPTIVQRVPLNHLASFLGITKFSLSRIRNQVQKDDNHLLSFDN